MHGATPVNVALAIAEIVIEETTGMECRDPIVALAARRVVGALLDCGWSAPVLIRKAAE